jgi:hypothetical protein
MNLHLEQRFLRLASFTALKVAVLALCEQYGRVRSHDFIFNRAVSRVLCFIELESPEQHLPLIIDLGGYTFGDAVCLEITVGPGFGQPGAECRTEQAETREAQPPGTPPDRPTGRIH